MLQWVKMLRIRYCFIVWSISCLWVLAKSLSHQVSATVIMYDEWKYFISDNQSYHTHFVIPFTHKLLRNVFLELSNNWLYATLESNKPTDNWGKCPMHFEVIDYAQISSINIYNDLARTHEISFIFNNVTSETIFPIINGQWRFKSPSPNYAVNNVPLQE